MRVTIEVDAALWAELEAHHRHLDIEGLTLDDYLEGVLRDGLKGLSGSRTGEFHADAVGKHRQRQRRKAK